MKLPCLKKSLCFGALWCAVWFMAACVHVKDMDDQADIATCTLSSFTPQTVVFGTPYLAEDDVVLPLDYGKYEFPVTLSLALTTAQTIDKILGFDAENTLVFETPDTERKINLIALSGMVHTYTVRIEVAPRSEEASILGFHVSSFSPASFLLAPEPVVQVVDSDIKLFGLDKDAHFPLTVNANMDISEGATTPDFPAGTPFVFDSFRQSLPVQVVASSGKKHDWTVSLVPLQEVTLPTETDEAAWERMGVGDKVQVSLATEGLELVGVDIDDAKGLITAEVKHHHVDFPWQASFHFIQNPYTQLMGYVFDEPLSVTGWEDNVPFYIMDDIENQARKWQLAWKRWLNDVANVTRFDVISFTSKEGRMELGQPTVDSIQASVAIPVFTAADFPLSLTKVAMEISQGAVAHIPDTLTFPTHRATVPFEVVAENGTKKDWNVVLDPWYKTGYEVTSFTVRDFHSQSGNVRFESMTAKTDSLTATVSLVLKAGYDFPLSIDAFDIQLSEGAVLQESYETFLFEDITTTIPLTVVAESGESKRWTLALVDERVENKEALVTSYYIASYEGTTTTGNNLEMASWGRVDTTTKTISLVITDWPQKMPLTVHGVLALSKNAILSAPSGFTLEHQFVFHSLEETHSFSVLSESKTVETHWTVQLVNEAPERSHQAEVVDFVTGTPSTGFEFAEKYLEPDARKIVLLVKTRPQADAVLTINPKVSVSEGAKLLDLVSGAPLALSFGKTTSFRVMAEDESITQWTVSLLYAPQLFNSGFELWGNDANGVTNLMPSDGKGWTTGNNAQVSGTVRVAGYNSQYAAQMRTQLKTMSLGFIQVTSLAAGAVLLGTFTLSILPEDIAHPSNMTKFGVPFTADANPIAMEVDFKYEPQPQRVYTEPIPGTFTFRKAVNVSGPDKATLCTELHHLDSGGWSYDMNDRKHMIASAEYYAEGRTDWTHLHVDLQPVPGKENAKMTHIVVRMSSSYEGDYFKGANNSALTVDNFTLIYYKPTSSARILN